MHRIPVGWVTPSRDPVPSFCHADSLGVVRRSNGKKGGPGRNTDRRLAVREEVDTVVTLRPLTAQGFQGSRRVPPVGGNLSPPSLLGPSVFVGTSNSTQRVFGDLLTVGDQQWEVKVSTNHCNRSCTSCSCHYFYSRFSDSCY